MKKDTRENLMIAALIFLAIISRVITNNLQLWNFNAIGAAALFGGMMIRNKRVAYLLPILTLFISDLFLQLFTNVQTFYGAYIGQLFFVYGAFLLTARIATRIKKADALTVLIASVGTGVLFFLVTNFGTFLTTNLYPHTFSGLVSCYAAGIPFYKEGDLFSSFALNGILGNVFFSAVLFGAHALIKQISFQPKKQLA
ncbi:DUF6580 family putative transport protein [Chitinophaga sp.]|uniref:DUF6580 family putative transport protein n=1 Tax=Chitinophaga sp. TaxID=1869181 RepID=UPI0031D6EFBA